MVYKANIWYRLCDLSTGSVRGDSAGALRRVLLGSQGTLIGRALR